MFVCCILKLNQQYSVWNKLSLLNSYIFTRSNQDKKRQMKKSKSQADVLISRLLLWFFLKPEPTIVMKSTFCVLVEPGSRCFNKLYFIPKRDNFFIHLFTSLAFAVYTRWYKTAFLKPICGQIQSQVTCFILWRRPSELSTGRQSWGWQLKIINSQNCLP